MDSLLEHFIETHPKDAATVLESCTAEEIFAFTNEKDMTNFTFLPYLSTDKILAILESISPEKLPNIMDSLSDMQLAFLVKPLNVSQRQLIFQHMREEQTSRIQRLLEFNDQEVGYYVQKPKLVLFEHNTIEDALNKLVNTNSEDLPIYLLNADYRFVGIVDIIKLIKCRDQQGLMLKDILTTKVKKISASSPLDSLLDKHIWGQNQKMVVTGKNGLFLGVISIDVLRQRSQKPTHEVKKTNVEEYIFFSEMLWNGLSKFWGTLK